MNVVVFMQNPPNGYSGGRYHAMLLAESLAARGHRLTIVSSNGTELFGDLRDLPGHRRINFIISKRFSHEHYVLRADVVVLIPSMAKDETLYRKAAECAAVHRARLVFLNFETPNWFNALSPVPRDPTMWDLWQKYGRACSVILCSAEENARHAREWFQVTPDFTSFVVCPPCINDRAYHGPALRSENRIVMFARFSWAEQKGCADLRVFLRPEFSGYTLVLITGVGGVSPELVAEVRASAARVGMEVEFHEGLREEAKVQQILRSRLLIFPSFFEGFGYPPVEALFHQRACVAFDLPVLREITGEFTHFVPVGDWDAFTGAMQRALVDGPRGKPSRARRQAADFTLEAFGRRAEQALRTALALPFNPALAQVVAK